VLTSLSVAGQNHRAGALSRWAVIAIGAALAACSSSAPDPIALDNADSGRVVSLAVGQEADLTLQTIGPGEFGDPTISSSSVSFLGISDAPDQNPGGPRQVYRFRAATTGRADITIPHVGDVAPLVTPSFTFSLVVP